MALSPQAVKFKDIILRAGLVDEYQLRAALARMEQWGGRLTTVIVEMGFCDDAAVVAALSQGLKVPAPPLQSITPDPTLLMKLTATYCEERGVMPLGLQNKLLVVAMVDPTDLELIDDLTKRLGSRVSPVLASEFAIRAAVGKHYRGESDFAVRRVIGFDGSLANAGLTVVDLSDMASETLTTEESERLTALADNQAKASLILKTVQALLREKLPWL